MEAMVQASGLGFHSQSSYCGLMALMTGSRLASLLGDWRGNGPAYRDLADAIRVLVIDARIPEGTRLPSERNLADVLDVSRTTTTRAFDDLRERGLLSSVRGSGSTVTVPYAQSSHSALMGFDLGGDVISLAHAAGAAAPGMGGLFEAAVQRLPGLLATTGYLPDGYEPLRERIAAHYAEQGLPTDPAQIIVTNGAQGAIATISQTIVSRGDRVLVEACGYPHGFDALTAAGGRVLPLPHDRESPWRTEDIRQVAGAATVALFVPDFHNPTGALMPSAQREEIASLLRRSGTQTVIDETMRDVNLDDRVMPPPFAVFDPDVITIGSLSKSAWSGLRLGWIRAPHHLVSGLVQTRVNLDLGSSAFDQVVATGAFDDAIRRPHREQLRAQRETLIAELGAHLPEFKFQVPDGGLSLWAELPRRVSSRLVSAALDHGLRLLPGSRFFAAPGPAGEQFIRLPFTQDHDVLREAVQRLSRAWAEVDESLPAPRRGDRADAELIAS